MSELGAPLARRTARLGRAGLPRRFWPVGRLALAGLATLLAGAALIVSLVDNPEGGRPQAEVAINTARDGNAVAGANALSPPATITAGPEIALVPGGPSITTFSDLPAGLPDDPAPPAAADLLEETAAGPIPRISGTGETPFAAYARPVPPAAAGRPQLAVIVSGLGLNPAGTLDAIERLPEAVTLAFAPYGRNLADSVAMARAEGHEILLEVPLEPFDYPENDPGPDTLLTGQAPRDNMEKLYRVMASIGGYVGLINNMGARFTASGADFGPMMEELGARGLGYIDDGSSARSLAPQLAEVNRVPFGRVDSMLDANPARAPILDALTALEDRARRQGTAIGIVSALPVSVQTIAEWARDLENRGVALVPASAVMQ